MFQSNIENANDSQLKGLLELFEKQVGASQESLSEQFNDEWDMSATYKINYACMWNNYKATGELCTIIEKNSRFAVVQSNELEDNIMQNIYRLEDLTLIKKDT